MSNFRADLHMHTNYSDGSLPPQDLIQKVLDAGLSGFSITDHDTIAAYSEAIPSAKKAGLLLGAGIELSAAFEGMSVHLLGYDIDLDNAALQQFCKRHEERRKERNRAILAKLARRGMHIQEGELAGNGRPHIAAVMVEKGYVASMRDAFAIHIGEGKLCYDSGCTFSVEESAHIVRGAGGKIFLAHPHFLTRRRKVRRLLQFPFDGIECYYGNCTPEQEQPWMNIAKERGWLISGGSDFHSDEKPHSHLGSSWVDKATFSAIFSRTLSN